MKKFILAGLIVLFIACPSAPKNSAKIYIERQEFDRAKEQVLIGLKETPTDYELYCLLAKCEIGIGKWLDASKAFQDGVKVDSASTVNWIFNDKNNLSVYWQAFYNAAVAHMTAKKYDEALADLKYCELIDPSNVNTYILQGGIYSELGNNEQAKQAYKKALSIDPENPEAYYLIGKAFFDKKQYDSALVKYNEAIKYFDIKYQRTAKLIFQNLPEIDKVLAQQIMKLWTEKKEAELDELVKVKLGFDAGLTTMKANIDRFYRTTDGLARSYYYAGMSYYNLKKDDLALTNINKSLTLMPEDLDALYFSGELLIKIKNYQEAIKRFESVAVKKPDDLYAWFYIAVAHMQLKDYKKAIDILEGKVLVLDPKNIDAMTNLAFCYREIGNNKKALEYLMKAEKLQKEK